jgi:Uma2 family endonuclease
MSASREEKHMVSVPKAKAYTFEDFCFLVREDQKADLIDGVIYMASPDNTEANQLSMWLIRLIGDFVEEKDLGEVFASRVAFRLDDANAPEPDIAFVSQAHRNRIRRGHVEGPPDLAIEIVSPDSVDRDYEKKRALYQRAGVTEYWIVDELQETVTLLRLTARGKYREVRARKGELHSEVLPGFWLRPEWLWQDPRPRKNEVLAQVLARAGD